MPLMHRGKTLLLCLLLAALTSPAAYGGLVFLGGSGGSISYDGTATGALIGTSIPMPLIVGSGTPLNDGVPLPCTGCVLNFFTGSFLGGGPGLWTFDAGGVMQITDGVTTWAQGIFSSTTFVSESSLSALQLSPLLVSVDPNLQAFYGLTPAVGSLTITFTTSASAPNGFTSTSISNAALMTSVPEPSSIALVGLGLGGLILFRRRRPRGN